MSRKFKQPIFLFDLGGTNIRLAVSHDGRTLGRPVIIHRPRGFASGVKLIKRTADQLLSGTQPGLVVGGIAGVLDRRKTTLYRSPHLNDWVRKPIKRELERVLGAPVCLENDADLIGLGEANFGAGRGHSIVASIAIGTGIGGTRTVDGQIDRNALGFEPGHHYLDISIRKHKHISPHPGDWESLVSGSAMRLRYGKPAEQVTDKRIWKEMAERVALGLINVGMFWSPDIIVLGGSLMKRLPLGVIRRIHRQRFKLYPQVPKIVRSKLGDRAGLYGGLAFANKTRNTTRKSP